MKEKKLSDSLPPVTLEFLCNETIQTRLQRHQSSNRSPHRASLPSSSLQYMPSSQVTSLPNLSFPQPLLLLLKTNTFSLYVPLPPPHPPLPLPTFKKNTKPKNRSKTIRQSKPKHKDGSCPNSLQPPPFQKPNNKT